MRVVFENAQEGKNRRYTLPWTNEGVGFVGPTIRATHIYLYINVL